MLFACSRSEDQSAPIPGELKAEEAKSSLRAYGQEILSRIRDTENPFELAAMRKEYLRRGGRSEDIMVPLEDKWQEVTEKLNPIGSICAEVDVVAYDYRKIIEDVYRLSILFKATGELDEIYRVYIHGYVDKSNINALPSSRRRYGFDNWSFEPLPPTSVWDAGKYIVASTEFAAQSFPYLMKIGFYRSGEGSYGDGVEFGWVGALDVTEEELIERIAQTTDIIDLYEIYKICEPAAALAGPILQALKDKRLILSGKLGPACSISPEVELVDFRFRKLGKMTYRLYYLFNVKKELDENYRIYVHGYVKKKDMDFLSDNSNKKNRFENWSFAPNIPTSFWKPGEEVFVTHDISSQPIPYHLKTGFYIAGGGGPGVECDLGWVGGSGNGYDSGYLLSE